MLAYKIREVPFLRVLGRTNGVLDPFTAFWTASGLEVCTKAKELFLTYRADYSEFEPWLDVVIDGATRQRFMLEKGEHRVCVYRFPTLPAGEYPARRVMLLRDTPAMPRDEETLLQFLSFQIEGEFLPVPERARRVEFIGDSITSAEGAVGGLPEEEWTSECFDPTKGYAFLTAQELGADFHILGQSGWGVFQNWLGDRREAMPLHYEKLCSVVGGSRNRELGAQREWDFSSWQPDAVVVNLGTNDWSAYCNGADCTPADLTAAVRSFLGMIRRHNPKAPIIWALGMLEEEQDSRRDLLFREAVEGYARRTGDSGIYFLALPPTLPGEYGSRMHPGYLSHQKAARHLAGFIRKLWEEET